jgi:hypothetical protein
LRVRPRQFIRKQFIRKEREHERMRDDSGS